MMIYWKWLLTALTDLALGENQDIHPDEKARLWSWFIVITLSTVWIIMELYKL